MVPLFLSGLVCAHAAYGFGRVKPMNGLHCEQHAQARSVYESSCRDLSGLVQQHVITCYSHCCNLLICSQQLRVFAAGVVLPEALLCHISTVLISLWTLDRIAPQYNWYWAHLVCVVLQYLKQVEHYEQRQNIFGFFMFLSCFIGLDSLINM